MDPGPWREGYVRPSEDGAGPGPWRLPEVGDSPGPDASGLPAPGPLLDRAEQALSALREREPLLERGAMATARLLAGGDKYTPLEQDLQRLRVAPDSVATRRRALSLLRSLDAIRPEDLTTADQRMIGLSDAGDAAARARTISYASEVRAQAAEVGQQVRDQLPSVPWGWIAAGGAVTVVTIVGVSVAATREPRKRRA